MDITHDSESLKLEKDDQLQKFYKTEFEMFLESKNVIDSELSKEELKLSYSDLSNAYYKALKKMMKITNIGDSTQFKLIKAQETLRIQEEKLRAIFDNAIAGIVTLDLNAHFVSFNNNFIKMLNLSEIHLDISTFLDCVYKDDQIVFTERFQNLANYQNIKQFHIQLRLLNQEGYIWSDISASVIHDSEGNTESVILIIADIDEQVKTQLELIESYGKLKSAQDEIIKLERQTTALAMAVTANHEINQPLMIMKANIDMLNIMLPDELKTDKIARYIQRVDESVERIKRILDQFQKSQHIAFDDYGGNTTMVSFSADDKDYQSGSDSFDKDDDPQNKK